MRIHTATGVTVTRSTYYITTEQGKAKGFNCKSKNPKNRCLIVQFECIGKKKPAKKKKKKKKTEINSASITKTAPEY